MVEPLIDIYNDYANDSLASLYTVTYIISIYLIAAFLDNFIVDIL